MTRPILLIGAGRMGRALLKGWDSTNIGPVAVIEPSPSLELRKLSRSGGIALHKSVEEAGGQVCACVVALKPQVLRSEGARLKPIAESGALMISIAAGINTKTLALIWGRDARIIRAMPNTPGAVGKGISALFAGRRPTCADRKLAECLLSALGETLWVARERLIDSVTAVSGSGPAYVFLLTEALASAGRAEGLPESQAERIARATIIGAAALLEADSRPASKLRGDVTSAGGTTEAALQVLLGKDGLQTLLGRAVRAARMRAEELSR